MVPTACRSVPQPSFAEIGVLARDTKMSKAAGSTHDISQDSRPVFKSHYLAKLGFV